MTKKTTTTTNNKPTIQERLADLISNNVEVFRDEASKAYAKFTKKERNTIKKLSKKDITGQDVLASWENKLLPIIHNLESKRTEAIFKKSIAKNLFLDSDETQAEVDQIITKRKREVTDKFLNEVYPSDKKDIYKKQRKRLNTLLLKPEEEILQLKNHQSDYIIYQQFASDNDIAVIDLCDSKSTRKKIEMQIEAEKRQVLTAENDRLYEIKNRLNSLSAMSSGVLIDILDKKWDLNTVLALREQYEKAISKFTKKEANNAIKRLDIFDKETSSFRNEQTNKLVINAEQVSLATARTITKDIDSVLLRVFDLTEAQKDQLIQNAKEYRELTKEQASIIEKQNNRLRRA